MDRKFSKILFFERSKILRVDIEFFIHTGTDLKSSLLDKFKYSNKLILPNEEGMVPPKPFLDKSNYIIMLNML